MPDVAVIDTKTVTNHRKLRFATLEEAIAEAERLAEAERAGTLKRLGNWTLGQAIGHVAYWGERAHKGYPPKFGPPKFLAWLLKFKKAKYLNDAMPQGIRIPGVAGGTLHTEPMETGAALDSLKAAFARLKSEPPRHANAAFGPMSQHEWIQLNLRHAELHFGYFVA